MSYLLHAQTACVWEATARKIGNVHPGRAFEDLEFTHFLRSALAIGPAFHKVLQRPSVGALVLEATQATRKVVGINTNLGMILLLAPLAIIPPVGDFRFSRLNLDRLLKKLKVGDAAAVYRAIRLANPGGLGDSPEQDVKNQPTVTLLEAMRLAADRDMVARQYANGFKDVFDFGVPAFLAGMERFGCVEAAIIDSQLRWLAEYPDSLIARKNGPEVAEDVRQRAVEVLERGGIATAEGRRAGVALDKHLRRDGNRLNPGTTADLITACLFVALRENKVVPTAPFRWDISDWL